VVYRKRKIYVGKRTLDDLLKEARNNPYYVKGELKGICNA